MITLPNELNGTINFNVTTDLCDYQFYLDCQNRRFHLIGEITPSGEDGVCDESNASRIAREIIRINQEDQGIDPKDRKRIVIFINSGGGDTAEGYALIGAIQTSETPVDIVSFGRCMSMAFMISLAGDRRFALPYTQFLLHDGGVGGTDSTNKFLDYADFKKRCEKDVVKPYVLKHSKMTEKEYAKFERKEFYMLPEDALKYGFIDGIIEKPGDMP
ncbi:ATP-dependent Clp protease proteolytic subunit [Candidatus Saccharibacteria bacterium]|nr:ATP-dependent Clp protease proteolytic subunit [Candidatus Saccharibacteria bacterium]